jgi:hypothetical protein
MIYIKKISTMKYMYFNDNFLLSHPNCCLATSYKVGVFSNLYI